MSEKIGFMQGRLSEIVDDKIQAFPWLEWENEFYLAQKINLGIMEWTLDQERLCENPLITEVGRSKIKKLCAQNRVIIQSLTGDCFMQAPFWKAKNRVKETLKEEFIRVCNACRCLNINLVIVPLVDNGRLENQNQQITLVEFLLEHQKFLQEKNIKILFESDFGPQELGRFIAQFPKENFGINYDIGNSAALGFDPSDEFLVYGDRVLNVHVKDRLLDGGTVALGQGNANFESVFFELAKIKYKGNYILQTARADDGKHASVLELYHSMTTRWLKNAKITFDVPIFNDN